ncbi:hypothetical protein ACFX4N_23865 [Priestia sp. YIM B13551]|uniref:hypothetical protein n=1 Tax=Priestia sp. YIM B13551 TaxID=3366306 RepID=UPI00366FC318
MNNLYQQMQQDIANTANNLMTQMICADKGIDINQLYANAQQAHLQSIMQAEQQRQMNQAVKRYYQGNSGSFFSKLRDAFAPEPATMGMPGLMPQPMMGMPMQPMPTQEPMIQPQSPQDVAQLLQQNNNERMDKIEEKVNGMEQLLTTIATALGANQQVQQQPPAQQFQSQPQVTPQMNQSPQFQYNGEPV